MNATKRKYDLYQVDSFTREKFSGNPAGVVPHAEGLTDTEMQKIARELKNSETAFVFTPTLTNSAYHVEVRFFSPVTEVPICGHATIAAHFIRAMQNDGIAEQNILQKTKAGILPVRTFRETDGTTVTMTQGDISFQTIDSPNILKILKAIGLNEDDLMENCPVEIVSTGHSKVMVGIRSRLKLNRLAPDLAALTELSALINCNGYFVFTFDSDDPGILTHGRMFAPAIGINEDPVTGNANGPLGAYIVKHKLANITAERFLFTAKQGEAMNRPGTMNVAVDIKNGGPVKVEITGTAVVVFKTTIEI
jgi:PhzF family phenazine biosynthesis protein